MSKYSYDLFFIMLMSINYDQCIFYKIKIILILIKIKS